MACTSVGAIIGSESQCGRAAVAEAAIVVLAGLIAGCGQRVAAGIERERVTGVFRVWRFHLDFIGHGDVAFRESEFRL